LALLLQFFCEEANENEAAQRWFEAANGGQKLQRMSTDITRDDGSATVARAVAWAGDNFPGWNGLRRKPLFLVRGGPPSVRRRGLLVA
jgi:hypothetical protein